MKSENIEKIAQELLKMKEDGRLPSRSQLLDDFQKGPHLFRVLQYLQLLTDVFQHFYILSMKWNDLSTHPYESVVFSHLQRFQRYSVGLTRLSFPNGPGLFHCIDSYYPILKSVFELVVENRLAAAYLIDFGAGPESKRELANRILNYADLDRKKNNHKFKYIKYDSSPPIDIKPKSIVDFEQKDTAKVKEEIREISEKLNNGVSRYKINHWYPTKNSGLKKIGSGDPKYFGKMLWLCRDVLGNYAETELEREHWRAAYDSMYEILNRYSHPVLGYDDNLRPEQERLFDLYLVLCPFVVIFDKFVIPGLVRDLDIRMEQSPDLLEVFTEMEKLKGEIFQHSLVAGMVMNLRTD